MLSVICLLRKISGTSFASFIRNFSVTLSSKVKKKN